MSTVHFLLVYDRKEQRLKYQESFTDSAAAVTAYEEMEAKHRGEDTIEIVLVGADSIETVMQTHGNYFDAVPSASPYLAGV